ncbi:MAG TPA: FAD-dependent oxidoreductase [Prolixibacteraceae bacterium]|nr:FAD-dependent oxidoreductase [Prolixibacteraceae bacterium]
MKRRAFISNSMLAGGGMTAAILGIQCNNKVEPKQSAAKIISVPELSDIKFVTEPQREIKIFAKTDVLVIGGGPSGTAAAIAASKTGADTWLIERYNHLGDYGQEVWFYLYILHMQ